MKTCNLPGCDNPRRYASARRCEEHAVVSADQRAEKPHGAMWCDPCHGWVPSLLHKPKETSK